jgi:hypothetical protein
MSDTDKTKPWWVRVAEHSPREIHQHENGICDLPETPLGMRDLRWLSDQCHWDDFHLTYGGSCCTGCGCAMCTGQLWHRAERRRDRHRARRLARRLVTGGDWDFLA